MKPTVIKPLEPKKFGITSGAQWLLIAPSRYDDYTAITDDYNALELGSIAVVSGKIAELVMYDGRSRTSSIHYCDRISIVLINNYGGTINLGSFGRPGYEFQHVNVGSEVVIRGKVVEFNMEKQLTNLTLVTQDKIGKVFPIYGSIRKTAGERFQRAVNQHFHWIDAAGELVEAETGWNDPNSPFSIPNEIGFSRGEDLLRALHKPTSLEEGLRAIEAAQALSALSLIRKAVKRRSQIEPNPQSMISVTPELLNENIQKLPFAATAGQKHAMENIAKALRSPFPLDGLLSGDVGSGKTATFLVPLVSAYFAGAKCMILTPNLLLIKQVAREIKEFFPTVEVCTVTGEGINGDPHTSIIVGSTAILGAFKKKKLGPSPNFLVIDEQHRFSVEQRNSIAAPYTNVLEATATPIPRTAALAAFGNKSIFILRDIPVVKDIQTEIAFREDAKRARDFLLESLHNGRDQVAVIYPLVGSENADNGLKSIYEAKENWKKCVPEELIAVLHGKMTDEEKEEVIRSFRAGEKRFLIASTVIEVGLTLPDLKRMMIIGADRMGLVTLHQLRGRLARHGGEGDCLLFVENPDSEAVERLQILVDHIDGFTVAEKDAEQRGFGDFLSTDGDEQSGKTRTLFMGVKVGPREIEWAANEYKL